MARLDDRDSSYESSYWCQVQGRGNLLSEYGISRSHSFKSLKTFKEVCNDFYTDMMEGNMMEEGSQYLGFTHVRMSDIADIAEIRSEIPKMRILYDYNEEILIMKFMVGAAHELCAGLLGRDFDRVVQAQTGMDNSILPLMSTRFRGLRRMKEPDHAFKPSSRGLETDWPSVVFEVGVSEGLRQLQHDARFWLECSGGKTRIVIIACIDKTSRSLVIQRWQQDASAPRLQPARNMSVPNPYSRSCAPTLMQSLTLEEGQVYTGASLIILALLTYDTLPVVQGAGLGPNDFEITAQMLSRLNDVFWSGLG